MSRPASSPSAPRSASKGESKSRPYKIVVFGSGGVGKCWAKHTKLIRANGQSVPVQEIKPDDTLLGPDSQPRRVLAGSLINGFGDLFDFIPSVDSGAEPFTVNAAHILVTIVDPAITIEFNSLSSVYYYSYLTRDSVSHSLCRVRSVLDYSTSAEASMAAQTIQPFIWECSVEDYISLPRDIQQYTRMFRPGAVSFHRSSTSELQQILQNSQLTISESIAAIAIGLIVKLTDSSVASVDELVSHCLRHLSILDSDFDHSQLSILIDSLSSQHSSSAFPPALLTESLHIRQLLLAGFLLPSVDSADLHEMEFSVNFPILASQMQFLARSLGYKIVHHTANSSSIHQFTLHLPSDSTLSSLLSLEIPPKSADSPLDPSTLLHSHNSFSFHLEPSPLREYFGFTVTGPDSRLLLSDFTVTHNSSLTLRFHSDTFSPEYLPTIEDCYRKQCIVDKKPAYLDILDTAGQEEFQSLRDQWVREGQAFILVYSIASRATLDDLNNFRERILLVNEEHTSAHQIPMVLVGNKCDLEAEREVAQAEGKALAEKYGNIPFVECSALSNTNIDAVFHTAVREIRRIEGEAEKRKNPNQKTKSNWCTLL